jgi:hypothetical protein
VDGDQTEGCAEKCPISQRLSAVKAVEDLVYMASKHLACTTALGAEREK